ncbi:class I adenylate-forming enzyme family protein [Streptomyces sp. H51]|uniref:class I adenylate-forming enzyme family protein n=1 Tax=Streptomyces sp. H51 TaxID=3111770 RepID=UPI002D783FD4|nr:AMP-binding protein [Streptomyces sp. H51]
MWLAHAVRRRRQLAPGATALADETRTLTWQELDDRTDALACGLRDLGLTPGDRFAVVSRNRLEVVELYVAAAKAGVTVCPVNPTFPAPEVAHIVRNAGPACVIADPSAAARLGDALGAGTRVLLDSPRFAALYDTPRRALPLPDPDDVFAVVHTSATSGRAKGVALTHRAIAAGYTATVADFGFTPDDVLLYPCPLFHGSMVVGLALLAAGGTLVVQGEFTPQRFLAGVERFAATTAFLVPSMIRFVLRAKAFAATDLSSLREVIFGGAPMPEPLLREALERFGVPVRNSYGLSEGGPIATARYTLDGDTPLTSAGRMLPGCHIEILDEDGRPVPYGETGEVCVRGDGVMRGYWNDPGATARSIRDGRLRTGDLGYMDPGGLIHLVDRRGDVIVRGGQNVYPAEIERVLGEVAGVRDVAVVAAPSEEWGQVPVAFVVADGGRRPTVPELYGACAAQLGSYKRPAAVHFAEEIPRNAAGKVLRRVLKERLATAGAGR